MDRLSLSVAAGDLLVIVGLVLVGQINHNVNPLTEPLYSIGGIAPFVGGWALVASIGGIYRSTRIQSMRESLRFVTLAWLAAANIGLIARTAPVVEGGVTWPFALVITGFGLCGLLAWRFTVVTVHRRILNA